MGGWLGRRARKGRCATLDPRHLCDQLRHLGVDHGAGARAVAAARRRRRAARRRPGAVQHHRLRDGGRGTSCSSPSTSTFRASSSRSCPDAQPPDGVNFTAIANPEYERLVAEASTMTGAEACDTWNAAEEALLAEMDIVPFAVSTIPTSATAPSSRSVSSGSSAPPFASRRASQSARRAVRLVARRMARAFGVAHDSVAA